MTLIIFENWPDTDKGLRLAMARLVDDGLTYKEAIDLAKKSYVKAALIKMKGQSKYQVARKIGMFHGNLNCLLKKFDLMRYL